MDSSSSSSRKRAAPATPPSPSSAAKRPRTAPADGAGTLAAFGVPGLEYRPSWLSADEETELLQQVDAAPWLSELSRRVQHYGFKYARALWLAGWLAGSRRNSSRCIARQVLVLGAECCRAHDSDAGMGTGSRAAAARLRRCSYASRSADRYIRSAGSHSRAPFLMLHTHPWQCAVNEYTPGQGIAAHIDATSFEDHIASISLGSPIGMELSRDDTKVLALIQQRSLLVFHGESRYRWRHAIAKRKSDTRAVDARGVVHDKLVRSRRVSLTFRKLCGSQSTTSTTTTAQSPTTPTAVATEQQQEQQEQQ